MIHSYSSGIRFSCYRGKSAWMNLPFHAKKRPHQGLRAAAIVITFRPMSKNILKKYTLEAIDTLTACLKDRFDQSDFNMYAKLEQVLLKSAKSECCEEEIEECCRFYGSDLDDNTLKTQLQIFSGICKTNQLDTVSFCHTLSTFSRPLPSPRFH